MPSSDTPYVVSTIHRKRNLIITIVAVITVVVAFVVYALLAFHIFDKPQEQSALQPVPDSIQAASADAKTVQDAEKAISSYYANLSKGDSTALRNQGFDEAANAIDNKWLQAISYRCDVSKVVPDVQSMPANAGVYAGNKLYKISDFLSSPQNNVVYSAVTGTTGCEGWIYYDIVAGRWKIEDPTIPTATQRSQSTSVTRVSEDKSVTVKETSSGAVANPWWSYAQVYVEITSSSTQYAVSVAPSTSLDDGMTLSVPDTLKSGVSQAVRSTVTTNGAVSDANANQNASNANTEGKPAQIEAVTPIKSSGICTIYRGVLNGFSINKIGSSALSIDGDISPVDIETPSENITPIFIIGTASESDIQNLINQNDIDKYGATDKRIDVLPALNNNSNANAAGTNANRNAR